jgi:hypothetical protein
MVFRNVNVIARAAAEKWRQREGMSSFVKFCGFYSNSDRIKSFLTRFPGVAHRSLCFAVLIFCVAVSCRPLPLAPSLPRLAFVILLNVAGKCQDGASAGQKKYSRPKSGTAVHYLF